MDDEIKLNVEKWSLKLDDKIRYVLSLENNKTFILTEQSFFILKNNKDNKDLLNQHTIPITEKKVINNTKSKVDTSQIWSDKNGIHVIFKLNQNIYYYNNNFPDKDKIKELKLELNKEEYLEPYSFAFNDNNENLKSTDEILFTDKDSCIYTLIIKIEKNGDIE